MPSEIPLGGVFPLVSIINMVGLVSRLRGFYCLLFSLACIMWNFPFQRYSFSTLFSPLEPVNKQCRRRALKWAGNVHFVKYMTWSNIKTIYIFCHIFFLNAIKIKSKMVFFLCSRMLRAHMSFEHFIRCET